MFWIVEQTDVEPTVEVTGEPLPSNVIPFRRKTRPAPGPQVRWMGPFAAEQIEGLLAMQEAAIARLRHPSGRTSTDEPAAT